MSGKSWQHLIKPYKMAFEKEESPQRSGSLVVEPLERGFGLTIGNALRRILLSSIRGTAVVCLKIQGAPLEFSSLPGIEEDVTDIILNLKRLDLHLTRETEGIEKVFLSAKGPCVVTAGMIQAGNALKILDPNQIICRLGQDATLSMELEIARGKNASFEGAQTYFNADVPRQLGEIVIDFPLFNPIRSVSYQVERARVDQSTSYDRLILDVETNGSITPQDAISEAAAILADQLKPFMSFDVEGGSLVRKPEEGLAYEGSLGPSAIPKIFFMNVKNLNLPVRCLNCLQAIGIIYVGDLVKKKETDLMRTPNFGKKSLDEIKKTLSTHNLKLGMNVPDWPPETLLNRDQEEKAGEWSGTPGQTNPGDMDWFNYFGNNS